MEIVSLDEAKTYLRIDGTSEDQLITHLINSAPTTQFIRSGARRYPHRCPLLLGLSL